MNKKRLQMRVVYRHNNSKFEKCGFMDLKKGDEFILLETDPKTNTPRSESNMMNVAKTDACIPEDMNVGCIQVKDEGESNG